MERVSVIEGDENVPLLLIAPHGAEGDDDNTALITEKIAEDLGCYAVINRGFERADKVDYDKSHADCNNVEHILEDVVKDEFLAPIQKYVSRIQGNLQEANIFVIHGMGNAGNIDMVVGFGDSSMKSPWYSCELWRKNGFMYLLKQAKVKAYQGKAGGKYAGARKNNLNQYYRQWQLDESVHSMQVEIVRALRVGDDMAAATASLLGDAFHNYLDFLDRRDENGLPKSFSPDWENIGNSCPSY
jgi:hypothetical protein